MTESEEKADEHAEIIASIASDLLPKLVDLLQEILPQYRQRTIEAAMILVKDCEPDRDPEDNKP